MMEFRDAVPELIRRRSSVRRFVGEPLSGPARAEMERACAECPPGPLGNRCRFMIADLDAGTDGRPLRLGSYGIIWGARTFLVGAVAAAPGDLEDFGYLFETLVLKATDLQLGTCWLGGTFRRSAFARLVGLTPEEHLPAVSPVGTPTDRRSGLDRVIRWGAGSARRQSWEEMFFHEAPGRPLSREQAGSHAECLEMLRLAPSASNRQPWRVIRSKDMFHLYLRRTPGYRRMAVADLQRVDLGIAMSHFELTARWLGLPGQWRVLQPAPPAGGPLEYTASWSAAG